MKSLNEQQALSQVVELLESYLKSQAIEVAFEPRLGPNHERPRLDLAVSVGGYRFVVEYKSSNLLATVAKGIEQLSNYTPMRQDEIRVLAVPFMGEVASRKCEEAGISWLDLSGNADISGPGLRIHVRGEKNRFVSPGRRENPFAPKSSRIARHLLYRLDHAFTQRELADETGLSEGLVSRIVKTLETQQLLKRDDQGRLTVGKPALLLEAWMQGYDFSKHEIVKGHVAGRSGDEIQVKLGKHFQEKAIEYATPNLHRFEPSAFICRNGRISAFLSRLGFARGRLEPTCG